MADEEEGLKDVSGSMIQAQILEAPVGMQWITHISIFLSVWGIIRTILWAIVWLDPSSQSDCSDKLEDLVTAGIPLFLLYAISVICSNTDGHIYRSFLYVFLGFLVVVHSLVVTIFFVVALHKGCQSNWVGLALIDLVPISVFVFAVCNGIVVILIKKRAASHKRNIRFWLWGRKFVIVRSKSQIIRSMSMHSFGQRKPPLQPWYIRFIIQYILGQVQTGIPLVQWDGCEARRRRAQWTLEHLRAIQARQTDVDQVARFMAGQIPQREGERACIAVLLHVFKPQMEVTDELLNSIPQSVFQTPPTLRQRSTAWRLLEGNTELFHHVVVARSGILRMIMGVREVLAKPPGDRPATVDAILNDVVLGPNLDKTGIGREKEVTVYRLVSKRQPDLLEDGPLEVGTVIVSEHFGDASVENGDTWQSQFYDICPTLKSGWIQDFFGRSVTQAIRIVDG